MRRRKPGRGGGANGYAVALGVALLLSLFCSVRFALLVAAVALIYVGVTCRC